VLASGDQPAQRHSFRKARPLPTGKPAGEGLGIAGPPPQPHPRSPWA
jgi:hypothetical protein